MTKSEQRHGDVRPWCGAVLVTVWTFLVGVLPVGAQVPHARLAVLTPGLSYNLALEGLREGLAQLGYQEGTNMAFLVEDAQGEVGSLPSRAATLVAAKPDVLCTIGTAATAAAKQATTSLPIVFTFVGDPLRSGLVASYTSSQNNVTGVSTYSGQLAGKRLEILQEIAPGITRVLALVAPHERTSEVSFQALADVAAKRGIEVLRQDVTSQEDLVQTLTAVPKGAVDAIYHVPSNLVGTHIALLIHKAREDRIPLAVHESSTVEQGALASYGSDLRLVGRQAAPLVVKILKGAKPSELPFRHQRSGSWPSTWPPPRASGSPCHAVLSSAPTACWSRPMTAYHKEGENGSTFFAPLLWEPLQVFESLAPEAQAGLQRDLLDNIQRFNQSGNETMRVPAEYLEVVATRR